jgi:hypothetical protein
VFHSEPQDSKHTLHRQAAKESTDRLGLYLAHPYALLRLVNGGGLASNAMGAREAVEMPPAHTKKARRP